jgi:4-diphosphocytidyl-2-C-methyl-D-erythritol kinase
MSLTLHEDAPAKVNLFLHVVGRRPDGYHLLDSLAVFADVADRLSATPGGDLALSVTGPFASGLSREPDNLVLRAARALAEAAGIAPSGRITLEKNLPVASGIGGGSADAAAALRLLRQLWAADIPPERLTVIAQHLGADVPVCLAGQPARMGGIGERLLPAPRLPEAGLVLINPGVGVATPAVFKARSGGFNAAADLPAAWPDVAALAATLRMTGNDLEAPARQLVPVIGDVLQALAADRACLLARMSGSGATCFGLYPSASAARAAAGAIGRPGWWVWGGGVRRGSPGPD